VQLNVLRRILSATPWTKFSEFPLTLGRDCAGTVVEVGGAVSSKWIGQEVYCAMGAQRQGSFADYVVASANSVSRKPASCSFVESAAIPYVGLTVWTALVNVARLNSKTAKGKRILIHGAAGGIGSFAVQLMKAWGAVTVCVCSANSIEFVKSIGGDHVVDYNDPQAFELLSDFAPFDVILDPISSDLAKKSANLLGIWRNCIYVDIASPFMKFGDLYGFPGGLFPSAATLGSRMAQAMKNGRLYMWSFFAPNGRALRSIGNLIDEGKIKPKIDEIFEFENLPDAFEKVKKLHGRGKTVIKF